MSKKIKRFLFKDGLHYEPCVLFFVLHYCTVPIADELSVLGLNALIINHNLCYLEMQLGRSQIYSDFD